MKVETKFNLGQKVWCIDFNNAKQVTIVRIKFEHVKVNSADKNGTTTIVYQIASGISILEERLFKTKKELIESL